MSNHTPKAAIYADLLDAYIGVKHHKTYNQTQLDVSPDAYDELDNAYGTAAAEGHQPNEAGARFFALVGKSAEVVELGEVHADDELTRVAKNALDHLPLHTVGVGMWSHGTAYPMPNDRTNKTDEQLDEYKRQLDAAGKGIDVETVMLMSHDGLATIVHTPAGTMRELIDTGEELENAGALPLLLGAMFMAATLQNAAARKLQEQNEGRPTVADDLTNTETDLDAELRALIDQQNGEQPPNNN